MAFTIHYLHLFIREPCILFTMFPPDVAPHRVIDGADSGRPRDCQSTAYLGKKTFIRNKPGH